MKLIKSLLAAAATAAAFAAPMAANATATVEFIYDEGLGSQIISSCADGSGCDADGQIGSVVFVGGIGIFNVNVQTGLTKPILSGPEVMDINSSVTSTSNGTNSVHTLKILWSDTGFTGAGVVGGGWGGTMSANGNVSAAAYYSLTDTLFATDGSLGSMGAFSGGPFASNLSGGLVPSSPYSLTQSVTITSGTSGQVAYSGDFSLNVPEPGSIALVGVSLVGLGVASRRRKF